MVYHSGMMDDDCLAQCIGHVYPHARRNVTGHVRSGEENNKLNGSQHDLARPQIFGYPFSTRFQNNQQKATSADLRCYNRGDVNMHRTLAYTTVWNQCAYSQRTMEV